jgi:thymidylate synthase (FAD)
LAAPGPRRYLRFTAASVLAASSDERRERRAPLMSSKEVHRNAEALVRPTSPEMDELLGRVLPVLDDGFVRVIDYMGTDASVVQAARVSYGAGTKAVHEDRGLIRYLMRHAHTTPFEMCELKLHVRVPMDTWRQWIRHRTANVNEYSTRYSVAIDAAQRTPPGAWRAQATTNRQGSAGWIPEGIGAALTEGETDLHQRARKTYGDRLAAGVAREQARKDLPLSTYTEAYWKIDLHNLLHFLRLRMAPAAQLEIRSYASVIGHEVVSRWCPMVWEAFEEYSLDAVTLSRAEREILRHLARGDGPSAIRAAREAGILSDRERKPSRERVDLERKLTDLGFALPWLDLPRG